MARPSKYPESFRRDAVQLVLASDRPIRQIAGQLGVSHETLRSWVRDARRANDPEQVAQAEQAWCTSSRSRPPVVAW